MKNRNKILPEISRLTELLSYDPETGKITWRVNRYANHNSLAAAAGSIVGSITVSGYRFVRIDQKFNVYLHRAAWAMHHGEWPEGDVDHINMDRLDNRIINLRIASRSQNLSNRGANRNNKLKTKGVTLTKNGRFNAEIWKDYKKHYIGRFDTLDEAREAYFSKAKEIHGEFARIELSPPGRRYSKSHSAQPPKTPKV